MIGYALAIAWGLSLFVGMIVRGVPTPPGRPDGLDYVLIACTPVVLAIVAVFTRRYIVVWSVVGLTVGGAWFAWIDNTRLFLWISYHGWSEDIRWWAIVLSWLVIGGRGLPGVVWCIQAYRRANAKGICCHCGYDLRASKDRCPECGTPIEPHSDAN
ncbi:MAG: hypothetical protein QM770_13260 [Tepidisphaeraceae bacterium]